MSDGDARALLPDGDPSDRLDSWKEIAAHLKRQVRTVQRWEKDEGLPVHRLPHKKLGTVFAYTSELDAWWQNGHSRLLDLPADSDDAPPPDGPGIQLDGIAAPRWRTRRHLLFGAAALTLALAGVAWLGGRVASSADAPRIDGVRIITRNLSWKDSVGSDGSRVYYTEHIRGQSFLVWGTDTGPVSVPLTSSTLKIADVSSRNGKLLLVDPRVGQPGTVMFMSGTSLWNLGVTASCAAWAPDGEWIALCRGNSIVRTRERNKLDTLATLTDSVKSIVWSPDGKTIRALAVQQPPAMTDSVRTSLSLWEIDLETRHISKIELPESVRAQCGASMAWTRDGRYFGLAPGCEPGESSIWLQANATGASAHAGHWVRLGVDLSRVISVAPAPEPDSLLLLNAESGPAEPTRYDPATGRLSLIAFGTHPVEFDYSRHGDWVTFIEYPQRTLWRARPDGSDLRQLTQPPLIAQLPHWSPDARTIAFSATAPGSRSRVYLIDRDGSNLRQPSGAADDEGSPTWSPDGRSIVFGDVEINNPASHFIRRLDLLTGRLINVPNSRSKRTARWSPDGRFIAAIDYSKQLLDVFDVATGQWWTLAGRITGDTLNWSADSCFVYFDGQHDAMNQVFRADIQTGHVEVVLDDDAIAPARYSNAAASFSLAPDGGILLDIAAQSSAVYEISLAHY